MTGRFKPGWSVARRRHFRSRLPKFVEVFFPGCMCAVPGCLTETVARGYCSAHWQRLHRSGKGLRSDVPVGSKIGSHNSHWKGGVRSMTGGRVLIYQGTEPFGEGGKLRPKYKLRYRLQMEAQLGRELRTDELVHHKNENPTDDEPENLEKLSASQHMRLHNAKRRRNSKGQFIS